MKPAPVICILFLFVGMLSAQEQIKRNVYSLGGSIYYSSTNENYTNNYKINISAYYLAPTISYFIADQCEASVNAEYNHAIQKFANPSNEITVTDLALGLGLRYYFPLGTTAPFIGVSGQTSWYHYNNQSFSTPRIEYVLTGGIEIFISKTAAIEPAINYLIYHDDQLSISRIQVGIGAKYFIL